MHENETDTGSRLTLEDEYFRRRDQALMEEICRRSDIERDRLAIGNAIGVSDHEMLVALQLVGYKADTIVLLELAPLLQVAWTDGRVSTAERDVILRVASRERVVPDSPAHIKLQLFLDRRPPVAFFETSLCAIQLMLADLAPTIRDVLRRKLLVHCTAVAMGATGMFGRRDFSAEDNAIEYIKTALADADDFPGARRHANG